MTAYLAIFSARARLLFQYRAAALAGLVTQLFWGFMKVMVFTAFYQGAKLAVSEPITLEQTITYIWLSQSLLGLLPWNIDREVEQLVRSGNVAYELIKPLKLYWYWFSRAAAMRLVPTILRALPVLLFAVIFFQFPLPASLASAGTFFVGLTGAFILSSTMTTLVIVSLCWTVTGEGLMRLMPPLVLLLSGLMIPLPLFPDWAQPIVNFLPFRGILDTPFRLYSGYVAPSAALPLLLHQWIWIVALIAFGQWLLQRATKRLVIHGG